MTEQVSNEFDADTRLEPAGADGEFAAELTDRWNGVLGLVNGGYQVAICVKALAQVMPFADPLVVSGFFLRPASPGPATVRTSLLRAGRTMAFGEASLWRNNREVVRATAVFASLNSSRPNDLLFLGSTPPQLPPPDEAVGYPPGAAMPNIASRLDYRVAELPGWVRGQPSGNPALEFWMRFKDGTDADLTAVPLLVDAAAPAVLELGAISTTVQLTVHLRAHPAPGWLACRAVSRNVSSGYHEEDFEIWDSAGTLVAQSRQLCLIVP
jgi:acyl-coenzyme A thioesterase PaaI-like protein